MTTGFSWARVIGLFRSYGSRIALIVTVVLLSAGLGIVNPLLIQRVFDDALFPATGSPDMGCCGPSPPSCSPSSDCRPCLGCPRR